MTHYFNESLPNSLNTLHDSDLLSHKDGLEEFHSTPNPSIPPIPIDLEVIEPYDSWAVFERKNVIRQRYTPQDAQLWFRDFESHKQVGRVMTTLCDRAEVENRNPRLLAVTKIDREIDKGHTIVTKTPVFKVKNSQSMNTLAKKKTSRKSPVIESSPRVRKMSELQEKSVDEQSQDLKPSHTCNCSKSKCLRLYCECFAKGLTCGSSCNCQDCHNNEEYNVLRDLVVQETLEKNPSAFKSKYKVHEVKRNILHSRGCHCSKTSCLKEYCECFKAGTGCSRLCKCTNCKNTKIEIAEDEVKVYFDKVLRKRRKRSIISACFSNKMEILKKLTETKM